MLFNEKRVVLPAFTPELEKRYKRRLSGSWHRRAANMSSSQSESDVEIVGETVDPSIFENESGEASATIYRYFVTLRSRRLVH